MDVRSAVKDIITRYASPKFQVQDGAFARFKARDRKAGINVFIHVLPRIMEKSPRMQKEFTQLSRAIQLLDHPHVVRAMEVAQDKGIAYLVHSAVDETRRLSAQLASEPMDMERAGQIITQIGAALEYVGNKRVPHGALTPDQILLNENGEVAVLGVGLAGLAALLGARGEASHNAYLAPEQRLADHAPTVRGDVYSLAAILFRLLTGMDPDLDASSTSSLRADQINDRIPPAVGQVVARAMDADPLQRPRSPEDFVLGLLSAIRAPAAAARQPAASQTSAGETVDAPAWPEPLPFPERAHIPAPDMSILDEISQQTRAMLEQASGLIQMPTYNESLDLSEEDDLPNFDRKEWE